MLKFVIVGILLGSNLVSAVVHADGRGHALGGYRSLGELRRREPPTGADQIALGSVLVSLGLLRAALGGTTWYSAGPSRCPDGAAPYLTTVEACGGLRFYGMAGVALGGMIASAGVAYLVSGWVRRHQHTDWKLQGGGWAKVDEGGRGTGGGLWLRWLH
ncbi:MAG: hypothetical protein V3V08_18505 [Nannocystaceae bacterium]